MKIFIFSVVIFNAFFSPMMFATELESQLRCLYSKPATKQNIDVNVAECSYLRTFDVLTVTDSFRLYPVLSVGKFITEFGNGGLYGGGGGLSYDLQGNVDTYFEGGVYLLTKSQFGKQGEAFKNYGGHSQFFAKFGLNYTFYTNWMIGYAYIHISNGHQYETNPSYDAHSLTLGYRFR
jgi:hypothetical protein